MTFRTPLLVAAVLGALAAGAGSPAQAALPAPGCAGLAFSDEKGDVPAQAGPTATNLDITDGYFNTDAAGKVTATLKVAEMSLTPPPPATAVSWYFTWTVKDVTYYVSLETDLTGAQTFETGTYGPNAAGTGNSYQPSGEAKGSITEGPDGGITWEVPKGAQGQVGKVLTAPAGQSFQLVQNGLGGGVLLFGDETDPEGGKAYDVGKCEGGGATAPSDGTPTTPGGGGGQTTVPTPGSPQPSPKLPVTLKTKSAKLKKGSLTVKLAASEAVSEVSVRVRKGKKALGTGRTASIAKGKTKAIKVKAKKAKKGSYLLDVTARLSDGRLASGAFRLRIK